MFDFITPTHLIGLIYLLLGAVILGMGYLVYTVDKTVNCNLYCTRAKLQTVRDMLLAQQKILNTLLADVATLRKQDMGIADSHIAIRSLGEMCESHTARILDLLAGAEQRALLRPALAPMLLDLDAKIDHTIQRVEHGITVSANTQVMGGSAKGEFSRALTIIADKLGVDVRGKPVLAKPTILCSEYD
jgi:hypothetical protein